MALNPNVVVVAPNELITSDHLNRVRSNLDRLDTTKLSTTGGTVAGSILQSTGSFTSTAGPVRVGNDPSQAAGVQIAASGTVAATATADAITNIECRRAVGNTGTKFAVFLRGPIATQTEIGSISIASAGATAFNTTSDPRAKTPPPLTRGITDAAARVQAIGANAWQGHHLVPETGDPEAGAIWDFLSSHDIEDHAPYAVHGDRGAVDGDGVPVYQQVSYPDLVPLLFAALSQALDRIAVLEAAAP